MSNQEFHKYLEQINREVSSLTKGDHLVAALAKNGDYIELLGWSEVGNITAIRAVVGDAPQSLTQEATPTNFYSYLHQVIQPQISKGEISDGSKLGDYDDRKLRWSGAGVTGYWVCENQVLSLEIGPTTYPRYSQDLHRSKTDALKLILRGLQNYGDPYAYFSKAIGVTVIPISQSGYIYIGGRSRNVDSPGLLNFVAGLASFQENLEKVNFYADIQQELQEEIGIYLDLNPANTQFVGIAGNPFTSETDLVFVTQTHVPETHFETFPLVEHSQLIGLSNKAEVNKLLQEGLLPGENGKKAIAYGSRMGLEYLLSHHF